MLFAAIILLAAPASAQPALTINTQSVEMCPCSTTRVLGTLQTTPPGTYTLTSDSSWATVVPPSLSLGAGESGNIYMYITPDCPTAPGQYRMKLNAESSVGSASSTVNVNILECHGATLKPSIARKSACIYEQANFDIAVTNIGKTAETYNISTDYGEVSPGEVSLNAGETSHVTLYASPKMAEQKVTVTAASTTSYATKSASVTLLGENCYAPELSVAPAKIDICRGLPAKFSIVLKNIGTRDDRYALSGDFGNLGGGLIPVASGEQKTVVLEIPTENKTLGENKFYVTLEPASKPDLRVSEEAVMSIENCYSAQLFAKNASAIVCPGMPAEYLLTARNTGNLSDTYRIGAEKGVLSDSAVTIGAGDEKTISLVIGTSLNDTKGMESTVYLASKNANATERVTLSFDSFKNCYDFGVSADPEKILLDNRTNSLAVINVKNEGKNTLDFVMKLDGPLWAYLDPPEISIPAGEERPAYLYVAPAYGTPEGEYKIKVQATNNGKVSKTADIEVIIGNPAAGVPEDNETLPSGEVLRSESLKKTAYLIILGVIVIAAIFFLPDILSRKKKEEKEEEAVELKSEAQTDVEPDITAVLEETKRKEPKEEKTEEEAPKKKKRGRPPKKKRENSEDMPEGEAA